MRCGDGNQAFHTSIRIEMGNEIPGIESSHAVAHQGKSLLVAAEEVAGEGFSPFRNGARAGYFRNEWHDSQWEQGIPYAPKIFDWPQV